MAVVLSSAYANWGLLEAAVVSGDVIQLDSAIALTGTGSLPSGVTLQFAGGSINPATNTMTISGRIWAPPDVAIFTESTNLKLSKRDRYWANWFNGANVAAKWNNMIAAYARVSNRNRSGYTFAVAPGEYTATAGLDITGIRGQNRAEFFGSSIEFSTAGLVCVDITGSTGLEIDGLTIVGATGASRPSVGVLLARDNRDSLSSSGKHRFTRLYIDGEFSTAALYCVSAEECRFVDPFMGNTYDDGVFGVLFSDKNLYAVPSAFEGAHAGTLCLPGNGEAYLDVTTTGSTSTVIELTTGGIAGSVVGRRCYVGGELRSITANDANTITVGVALDAGAPAAGVPVSIHAASDASCSGMTITGLRFDGQTPALYIFGFDRVFVDGSYLSSAGTQITLDAREKSIINTEILSAYLHADEGETPPSSVLLKGTANTSLNGCKVTLRKTASDGDPGDPQTSITVEDPLGTLSNCVFDTLGGHFVGHEDLEMYGCVIRGLGNYTDPADEGTITLGAVFSGEIFCSFDSNVVQATDHIGPIHASVTSGDWPARQAGRVVG